MSAAAAAYAFARQPDGTVLVRGGTRDYTIIPDPQGFLCDCEGFRFRKDRSKTCKHIDALAEDQRAKTPPPLVDAMPPELEESDALPADEPPAPPVPPAPPTMAAPREPAPDEPLNDLGNARRLVRLHGPDLRYVCGRKRWYWWMDRRWKEDDTGEADRRAKAVVDEMYAAAARESDPTRQKALATHAVRSSTATRIASMLELASTEPDVVLTGRGFDGPAQLLNVVNGTLDLRTGKLRPHDRADLLTKLAPVKYDETKSCPRWTAFLDQVLGDPTVIGYVQRVIGYALTGLTVEHVFFLLHGTGANGKTTFLETLRSLLGDYACQADFSTFLARREDGPRNDVARLRGMRFVTASEVAEGRRFDEPLLKQLTGEDTVAARRLYQEAEEFRPQFKLFLAANHKPTVWGTDHAFWRRLRLIPFTITIAPERQDKSLRGKLVAEQSGILNWALEGYRAWRTQGLAEPDAVTAATRSYQADQDVLGQFLDERCQVSANGARATVEHKALFDAYAAWCQESGADQLGTRKFNDRVRERGFPERKSNGRRFWAGVTLAANPQAEEGPDDLPF